MEWLLQWSRRQTSTLLAFRRQWPYRQFQILSRSTPSLQHHRMTMSRMIPTGGSLLLGGMLSYLGLPCNDSGSADDDNIKSACSSQSALIEAIDQVLPSTVQLVVMISTSKNIPGAKMLISNGSGFVINEEGYILTNAHVISDVLEGGRLKLIYYDGTTVWGRVLAMDMSTDLAIVTPDVEGTQTLAGNAAWDLKKYPPVKLTMSESLRLGSLVGAIGSPIGLRGTVSVGVISGLNRSNGDVGRSDSRINYIQTDVTINPGSSGGPLIDCQGRVIGINTARADVDGISFAIQIDSVVLQMIDELASTNKIFRPYLGFRGVSLNPEILLQVDDPKRRALYASISYGGILVTEVNGDSPAITAGLKPGDIITHVGDTPTRSLGDLLTSVSPFGQQRVSIRFSRVIPGPALETHQATIQAHEFDILSNSPHDYFANAYFETHNTRHLHKKPSNDFINRMEETN